MQSGAGWGYSLFSVKLLFGQTSRNLPGTKKRETSSKASQRVSSVWRCDVILMTLLLSWRPPLGRLVFYQVFMKLRVPSPTSLRSHNASVMFCQVRHDGRGGDGVKLLQGSREVIFWSQAAFSLCFFFSSLVLKFVWNEPEPDVEPWGTPSQVYVFFFFLSFSHSFFTSVSSRSRFFHRICHR